MISKRLHPASFSNVNAQLAQFATEKTSYGVVSGLGVTQQTVPDMTVQVATGVIWMANGTRFAPTANNALAVTAADATNPRIDIIYINSSGVVAYLAGTPGATPAAPSTPAGGQKIAQILVTARKMSILTADISDYRKNMWTEAWITPTLLNSWGAYSGFTPKFKKDVLGNVYCIGSVQSGSTPSIAFVLPTGYRPPQQVYFSLSTGGASTGKVYITTGGEVYITQFATYMSFDGIRFSTT